jgi:ABC-2 type transport system permease protein
MTVSVARVNALLWKELQELRRTRATLTPVLALAVVLALPFVLTMIVPAITGQPLDLDDLERGLKLAERTWPEIAGLDATSAARAFFFQQFLLLIVIVPVTSAVTLATYSLVGEKQSRALEPLLAPPLTTFELLLAKVLAAFLFAVALGALGTLAYLVAIGIVAGPHVLRAMLTWRTVAMLSLLAPAATLVGLQLAVLVSSRVNDARTAQQIGTMVVLPLIVVLIGQGTGLLWFGVPAILAATFLLLIVWAYLAMLSVATFDREQILTRWRWP